MNHGDFEDYNIEFKTNNDIILLEKACEGVRKIIEYKIV